MARGDMTLRAVLKLAAKDFTRGISGIQKQLQGLGNYMKTAFAVGSVVSFGREMVKWTKEFEDAMARAKAVSNASADGFKMMNDEALRLGATTRYTSVQVAQTLEVLTRNGLSATNATRVLADTLRLAQANAVELADAGNMITNTLNMFGLSVDKAAYVTDILSATASHSATDLTSLYEAMTNAAPMAHALSMNVEEVAAALGALANVGVKGPDAGTQLRQFLQRLTDPLAMKKMKKMTGFAFDEDFISTQGLEGVLKKLQSLGLTVSQLNEIFTVRSSKSIIQLMNSMRNFTALLHVMAEAEGTTFRMFIEGVGSVRYELDILRSMWQNYMIDIGSSTEGLFLRLVRGAQNAITTIKQFGKSLSNIFTVYADEEGKHKKWGASFDDIMLVISQVIVFYGIFRKKIQSFYASMAAGAKLWSRQSITAIKMERAAHLKARLEEIASDEALSAEEKKLYASRIAAQKKIITMYKGQQKAAKALKATLTTMGWAAAIVVIETFITKLIAMNAELRESQKALSDAIKEGEKVKAHVTMLKDMIGDGSDTDSLTGAVREAKQMFSEFAMAIQLAADEAGRTGEYEKLKKLLEDIAKLQAKIMANKALQGRMDSTMEKYAQSIKNNQGIESQAIKDALKSHNYTGGLLDAAYQDIANILVSSAGDFGKQVKVLGDYFRALGIKVSDEVTKKFVNQNTPKWEAAPGKFKGRESYYTQAVNARNAAMSSSKNLSAEENLLKWNNAMNAFNLAWKDAAEKYGKGTTEYNEAMSSAFQNLKNELGDLVGFINNIKDNNPNKQYITMRDEYSKLNKMFGGSSSYADGSGSGSNMKTTQDEFNDAVKEYVDELKKLNEQLKNGTITQEHYDKAASDAKLNAVDKLSGFENIDKLLENLPESFKATANELIGEFKEYGKLMAENLILGFREKAAELTSQYENGPKDEQATKEYNENMDNLARETFEELSKIQDLYKIYDKLDVRVRNLWDYINNRKQVADEKDKQDQLDQLNEDSKIDVKEPKLEVILSPDDKSVKGMKQNLQRELDGENFEINVQVANDEKVLDATQDKIKQVENAINNIESELEKGDNGKYSLIKDEALERLHTLKNYLVDLEKQAETFEDKLEISKLIQKVNENINTMTKSTLDNISSLASAFDRLKDSVKDIAEAFGMEVDFEGLEKGITVVNAIIQAIESLKQISEVFQAFHELMTKKQVAENGELALSNATVAASESTKALATTEAAIADGAEVAAASSAAMAGQQQAAANYQVAGSAGAKAAATGAAAAAEGAESVASTPYVGPILAVAAAGAIAAALIAAFSQIKGFANGGIVGGNSFYGDKNLIRANTGEMVITRGDQRTLFRAIKSGNLGGGGKVEFIIKGDQLVGTLNNYSRIHR